MRRVMILCLAASAMAGPAPADVKGPGGKVIECYCTDTSGARVELGETICLFVDGRAFMAQCQMSLNVPMWREIRDGCETSHLSVPASPVPLEGGEPAVDPLAVHSKI